MSERQNYLSAICAECRQPFAPGEFGEYWRGTDIPTRKAICKACNDKRPGLPLPPESERHCPGCLGHAWVENFAGVPEPQDCSGLPLPPEVEAVVEALRGLCLVVKQDIRACGPYTIRPSLALSGHLLIAQDALASLAKVM